MVNRLVHEVKKNTTSIALDCDIGSCIQYLINKHANFQNTMISQINKKVNSNSKKKDCISYYITVNRSSAGAHSCMNLKSGSHNNQSVWFIVDQANNRLIQKCNCKCPVDESKNVSGPCSKFSMTLMTFEEEDINVLFYDAKWKDPKKIITNPLSNISSIFKPISKFSTQNAALLSKNNQILKAFATGSGLCKSNIEPPQVSFKNTSKKKRKVNVDDDYDID